MKILTITLVLLLLVSSPAWTQGAKTLSPADLAAYSGPDRERVLIEGAKREGKLVWYTTLAADQNKQLAGAFEAKYPGVKVETFRTGSSALAQRLLTEAKAKRHIADAIETTPPGLMTFRENQLLLPYTSPHLAAFPEEAKEKASKNLVYWTNTRESFIGFAYNKNFLNAADVPKNFDGLLKPVLRDNMGISGDDTGARIIGAMVKAKGDGFVRKLKEQNIRVHMMAGARSLSWSQREKSSARRASFTAPPTSPPNAARPWPGFRWISSPRAPAAQRYTRMRLGHMPHCYSPIFY